jgi:hypothetical protein
MRLKSVENLIMTKILIIYKLFWLTIKNFQDLL